MTATATATAPERAVAAFLDGDVDAFVASFAPDVMLDVVVPQWRFQLQGRDAVREALTEEFPPGRRVTESHVTPTPDGVLVEFEARAPLEGEERLWRELAHLRIAGDAVSEIVVYCSGVWDAATIARHAVEAPMVRPR